MLDQNPLLVPSEVPLDRDDRARLDVLLEYLQVVGEEPFYIVLQHERYLLLYVVRFKGPELCEVLGRHVLHHEVSLLYSAHDLVVQHL